LFVSKNKIFSSCFKVNIGHDSSTIDRTERLFLGTSNAYGMAFGTSALAGTAADVWGGETVTVGAEFKISIQPAEPSFRRIYH
jgi:hypothetical protein